MENKGGEGGGAGWGAFFDRRLDEVCGIFERMDSRRPHLGLNPFPIPGQTWKVGIWVQGKERAEKDPPFFGRLVLEVQEVGLTFL